MSRRPGFRAALAPARERADIDRRLGVNRDPQGVAGPIGLGVDYLELLKDRVGLLDFFSKRSPIGAPVFDLKRPCRSARVASIQGVRRPDLNGPTPHSAAPPPTQPGPTPPAAPNSSPGACNGPTPPSR